MTNPIQGPIDGLAGRIWRTVTFPLRAAAPFVLLARRTLRNRRWVETVSELGGPGPKVEVSERDDVQAPRDGAGPLNHRTYRIKISGSRLEAHELLEAFRQDPNRFSPTSYATFVPDPAPQGLQKDETFEVKLPGPWDGPILVRAVEPSKVRLETRVGHMEAGWIEFRCSTQPDGLTDFTIESFARSGDPVFDALYHQVGIGKFMQSEMWVQVLETAVEVSGGRQHGRVAIETTTYLGADR